MNVELIRYRLERAKESLKDAEILFSENRLRSTVNRLYYSLFYAAVALLETKGLSSSKHSGVMALFNQYFVNTGKVSKDIGKFYGKLFISRQNGDYSDFMEFKEETVREYFEKCKEYLVKLEKIITDIIASEK
ncbi:MAG: HEPN domain-containing protein [bacterium]